MFETGNPEIRPTRSKWRLTLAVACFVILGIMATAGVLILSSHFRSGDEVALGTALLGLPAIVLLVVGVRYAVVNALAFVTSSIRWWHVLWFLTFVSALVFRVRSANDIASNPVDAWAVFRIAVDMVVAFALLARLALRRTHWVGSMFQGVLGALTVFGLVCVASTVWSVFPAWTLYKSCEYLVDLALLAAILESVNSTEEYRNFFNWTWALYSMLLFSVWIGVLVWPHEAFNSDKFGNGVLGVRLGGVMPAVSSNDVGTFAAIIGLLSLARLFPSSEERFNKPWYALLLAGSMVTMVLSQTRTAIAGFLFGGFFILIFSKRGKFGAFLTFILAPFFVLVTMGGMIWSFLARGQTEEQLSSLSSRAEWWGFAWQTYLERPLTGFGAYAAGRFAVLAKLGLGETSTLHSDYLDVLVGTSFWGMVPFVVALAGTLWLLLRYARDSAADSQERQLAYEGLAIFALLAFRSVFMTMLTWHPPLNFLVILGYVEFLRRKRGLAIQIEERWPADHTMDSLDPQLEYVLDAGNPASPRTPNPSF